MYNIEATSKESFMALRATDIDENPLQLVMYAVAVNGRGCERSG
jgi:hypothetical protein